MAYVHMQPLNYERFRPLIEIKLGKSWTDTVWSGSQCRLMKRRSCFTYPINFSEKERWSMRLDRGKEKDMMYYDFRKAL